MRPNPLIPISCQRTVRMEIATSSPESACSVASPPTLSSITRQLMNVDGCLPPFARPDAQKITLLSVETLADGQNVLQVGWTAASEAAKKEFDRWAGGIECEGCGWRKTEEQIVQFGLCDHHICLGCLSRSNTAEMYPGTPLCCHQDCLPLDSSFCPTSSSSSSDCSLPYATMVLLKVFVFRDSAYPTRWKTEVNSSTPIGHVLDYIRREVGGPLDDCKVFFSTQQHAHRRHLKPLEDVGQRVGQIDHDHLNLVLVESGVEIQRCL